MISSFLFVLSSDPLSFFQLEVKAEAFARNTLSKAEAGNLVGGEGGGTGQGEGRGDAVPVAGEV